MTGQTNKAFNILIISQKGRLAAESVLFLASLRAADPEFSGKVFVAEPQPGSRWNGDPRLDEESRAALERMDTHIVPLTNKVFGQSYPNGNKIEALSLLPKGEPFVFFDTDTLIHGKLSSVPFAFSIPSASSNVTGT